MSPDTCYLCVRSIQSQGDSAIENRARGGSPAALHKICLGTTTPGFRGISGCPVSNSPDTGFPCAECTAEKDPVLVLRPVPKDSTPTMVARWSQCMNRALETIEDVRSSTESNLKGFIVTIAAYFAGFHVLSLEGSRLIRTSLGWSWRVLRGPRPRLRRIDPSRHRVVRPLGPHTRPMSNSRSRT
jgi:hypothetical protein